MSPRSEDAKDIADVLVADAHKGLDSGVAIESGLKLEPFGFDRRSHV
jgi:hypothetical protein